MKRIIVVLALGGVLAGCDGHQVTPAMMARAGMNMIASAINQGKPQGVQVGWTYSQVVEFQGKPERVYGHGTPVMVYPLPNNLQMKIGISGLDNQSKVLWVKTYDSMNREVKTTT